ncbi:putative disintegrin and metalloproteinase domain-containing protein 10 isoform X1 [Apostichopus japonicus]|uniref:ADAM10 endopeptidase n=1 Tax=Stichopus japonicus TaxID=307972 RepID=A0A2G8KWR0_STIJA|nr:putative disintegrin and metalloproteinase domain-containing protein 10 isoform X1 [Apostichopus japonicus]
MATAMLWECTSGARLSPLIRGYDVLTYDTDHVHEQHKRAIRSPDEHQVELRFNALGSNFQLQLEPDPTVITNNFAFVTSDGAEIKQMADAVHFYRGRIADVPGSFVHGSIVDGAFQGRIHSEDEKFSVEPARRYFNDSVEFHSVIYKDSHVDIPENAGGNCGLVGKMQEQMDRRLKEAGKMNPEKSHDFEDGAARYKRQATTAQTCAIHIITDHVYYKRFQDKNEIFRQMGEHVQAASKVFSDHNFQNGYDNIEFAIQKITLYDSNDVGTSYPFDSDYIGVEKFLDLTSEFPLNNQYCLVYTFTNRDFANGVLGLAWIATPTSTAGGVCSSNFNAGIVTTNNYGQDVPPIVSHLTFSHELGHSFGSRHDPDGDRLCAPGGSEGNFLMFAHASSGDLPNNNDFSSCSEANISRVLNTMGSRTNCLVERGSITLCGNQVRELTEECDCGANDECGDSCCTNSCQLVMSAKCRVEGMYVLLMTCLCAECPTPPPKANDTICDGGRRMCSNGECTRSICERDGRQQCQCAGTKDRCLLCCMNGDNGECQVYLNASGNTLTLDVGSPCESFMGYCDIFFECRLALEDGPLANIIRGIFYSDEPQLYDAILSWLSEYWWVVLVSAILLVGLMALIMFLCNLLTPTDNPWKEEVQSAKRNRVVIRARRDRGSQYPRSAPPE